MGTHAGRDRPGRGSRPCSRPSSMSWGSPTLPQAWHRIAMNEALPRGRAHRLSRCSCVPATCLGGRGMVIAYDEHVPRALHGPGRSCHTRPPRLPRLRSSSRRPNATSTLSATARMFSLARFSSTSRKRASIRATRPAARRPSRFPMRVLDSIADYTRKLALAVQTRGLVNIQFAVKDGKVYVIEVNPRASRTVPFTSKARGVPLAQYAARIMAGEKLADLDLPAIGDAWGITPARRLSCPSDAFPVPKPCLGPR